MKRHNRIVLGLPRAAHSKKKYTQNIMISG